MDKKLKDAIQKAKNALFAISPKELHINCVINQIIDGKQVEKRICSACKNTISPTDKVCPICGTEMKKVLLYEPFKTKDGNALLLTTEERGEELFVTLSTVFYRLAARKSVRDGLPREIDILAAGFVSKDGKATLFVDESLHLKRDMEYVVSRIAHCRSRLHHRNGIPRKSIASPEQNFVEVSAKSEMYKNFWSNFASIILKRVPVIGIFCHPMEHICVSITDGNDNSKVYAEALLKEKERKESKNNNSSTKELEQQKQNYPSISENLYKQLNNGVNTVIGQLITKTESILEIQFLCTCGNSWIESLTPEQAKERTPEISGCCSCCGTKYTAKDVLNSKCLKIVNLEKTNLIDDSILLREFRKTVTIKNDGKNNFLHTEMSEFHRCFISKHNLLIFEKRFEQHKEKWEQIRYDNTIGMYDNPICLMTPKQIQGIMLSPVGRSGILDGWDFTDNPEKMEYERLGVYQFPKTFLSFPGIALLHKAGLKEIAFDICRGGLKKHKINVKGKTIEEIFGVSESFLRKFEHAYQDFCSLGLPADAIDFTDGDENSLDDYFWAMQENIANEIFQLKKMGIKPKETIAAVKKIVHEELVCAEDAVKAICNHLSTLRQYGIEPASFIEGIHLKEYPLKEYRFSGVLQNMNATFLAQENTSRELKSGLSYFIESYSSKNAPFKIRMESLENLTKTVYYNRGEPFVQKFAMSAGYRMNLCPRDERLESLFKLKFGLTQRKQMRWFQMLPLVVEDASTALKAIVVVADWEGRFAVVSFKNKGNAELDAFLDAFSKEITG